MKSKNLTKDVAKAAGVFTQTILRAIINRPDMASDPCVRIQQIIVELGYEPNVIARSLERGQSHTLGVISYGLEYFGSTSISVPQLVTPDRVKRIFRDMLFPLVNGLIQTVPSINYENEWLGEILKSVLIPLVYLNKFQRGNDLIAALDNRCVSWINPRLVVRQSSVRTQK